MENAQIYNEYGNVSKIAEEIKKEGFYAKHLFIKFTADFLQTPIWLYKNKINIDNLEKINNDFGDCRKKPI